MKGGKVQQEIKIVAHLHALHCLKRMCLDSSPVQRLWSQEQVHWSRMALPRTLRPSWPVYSFHYQWVVRGRGLLEAEEEVQWQWAWLEMQVVVQQAASLELAQLEQQKEQEEPLLALVILLLLQAELVLERSLPRVAAYLELPRS